MEQIREQKAALAGEKFRPAIQRPYRWRDWAAKADGITGDELIRFVNQDEAIRPDGERGAGLFAYLRGLQGANGGDRRDVIASVFDGVINRMVSGYLLRDVINKVDGIHFNATDEIHTLGLLYESMLKEMRDAAGDSGEFYTPRPVVRFMVQAIDPQLGETILDPACGTGGFLVETYNHLSKQCKKVEDWKVLQKQSIFGGEAKPLPYLLSQMNLLLHGLEYPRIDYGNSLAVKVTEIGDKDRVDIILTNPPFGGEEEAGILNNFPEDKRTAETALLFLQLIMRKLRRTPKHGRAAVVVPNGTLFGDGVCARIKEDLLKDFNLHTVVRLPLGVFAPYTDQETALLFFDRDGPTKGVWYYEHALPADRQKLKNPRYNKSRPLLFQEFEPLISWWKKREINEQAWHVPIQEIAASGFNLDIKHPKHGGAQISRTSKEVCSALLSTISVVEEKVSSLLATVNAFGDKNHPEVGSIKLRTIEELGVAINPESANPARDFPQRAFRYVDLSSVAMNTFDQIKEIEGSKAPSRARRVIRQGDVILATVRSYLCGHAVVPLELDGEICSTGFAVLRCPSDLNPFFLYYMLISPSVIEQFLAVMRGAHYPALNDKS
jgi:type I restriction enzyme M protein